MIPKYCVNCIDNSRYGEFIKQPYYRNMEKNIKENIQRAPQISNQPNQQIQNQQDSPFEEAPGSPMILGPEYTQGYLRSIIGKKILVEFLIGTEGQTDRSGILSEVGISYIILDETETGNRVLCDIYSIKFVTIFQ